MQGAVVSIRALADSCASDEFQPAYCRVDESNENNNQTSSLKLTLPWILTIPFPK
jgi:hypothetical protein